MKWSWSNTILFESWKRSHRSFSSEDNFNASKGNSVQLEKVTGPLNFCCRISCTVFYLHLFIPLCVCVCGGGLTLRRHSIFLRTRHILKLPVVRGWNPLADFWVAGVRFAIALPASSRSVLNIGFQGVVGSSRAWCPRISIVMSVLCVVSVFCRGGTAANVCGSLLNVFCWGERSYYGFDSEASAIASPVSVTALWRRIQGVKISSFILKLGIRLVVTITLRPYICGCTYGTSALQEAESIVCPCSSDQFIVSMGVPEFLRRLNLYFMLFWNI
jgi:hypothetical protein